MSETLKGNLSQLKLVDILKILCNSQRTGKLSLQYGTNSADIYFVGGEIIHARHNTINGIGAIYDALGWNEGTFSFHPNISVKNKSIHEAARDILTRCEKYDADWQEIRQVIPHNNLVFKMSSGTPTEISLTAAEWNILRHINGIDSIQDISAKVEMPILDIAKAFHKLYQAGLIEIMGESVGQQQKKTGIDPTIFSQIEKELAQIIGPLAPIVLDDSITDVGENRDSFPKDKLPDLIEMLSREISDPKKLIDFQKHMLDLIKNI